MLALQRIFVPCPHITDDLKFLYVALGMEKDTKTETMD